MKLLSSTLRGRYVSVAFAAVVVCLGFLIAPVAGSGEDATDRVTISTDDGAHVFRIELADEPGERRRGLMFRRHLDEDAGMLFDNGREQVAAMWMKNTYIPLDMLFIAGDGRIMKIAPNTVPLSEKTISSGVPVRAVLELNGGTAERLGIREGDRVLHPLFDRDRKEDNSVLK